MIHLKRFLAYKNKHQGKSCIVCGLGLSLSMLTEEAKDLFYTIGVNDICNLFTPDYLIMSEDPMRRFQDRAANEKQYSILNSNPREIFSVFGGRFKHRKPVRVEMCSLRSNYKIDEIFEYNKLFAYRKITTAAISLAVWMGFKMIGVLGHDCVGPRAVNDISNNLVMGPDKVKMMDKYLGVIYAYCIKNGIQVFNLSDISVVKAIPFLRLNDFIKLTKRGLYDES